MQEKFLNLIVAVLFVSNVLDLILNNATVLGVVSTVLCVVYLVIVLTKAIKSRKQG